MILCGVMFYISDESSYLSGEDTLRGYVLYIGVMFSGERILCDILFGLHIGGVYKKMNTR